MAKPARPNRSRRLNINCARRERIEALAETLIGLLDEIDGDADLEPSLAFPEPRLAFGGPVGFGGDLGGSDDREPDGDELDYSGAEDETGGALWAGSGISERPAALVVVKELRRVVARRRAA